MSALVELTEVRVEPEDEPHPFVFTLAVREGEWLALVGPSRSGKSLVIEICAGLIAPDAGTVLVLGRDLASATDEEWVDLRVRIGTVLQQPGLLSNMTLFNNVALPLRYHRDLQEATVETRVMAQLEALGLASLRDRFPAQLKQGEIRCAAIARALILEPELLLLDDPAAGLDAEMVRRLARYLIGCRQSRSLTIISTMRTFSPLLEAVDRVAFLREGRIEVMGAPRDLMALTEPDMCGYLRPM